MILDAKYNLHSFVAPIYVAMSTVQRESSYNLYTTNITTVIIVLQFEKDKELAIKALEDYKKKVLYIKVYI